MLRAKGSSAVVLFPDLKCHLSCEALTRQDPTFRCDTLTVAVLSVDTRSDCY
jgi:hypothetical protein